MSEEWTEVGVTTAENFNIKEEKVFEGIYVGFQENVGLNKSIIYTFKDKTGKSVSIWGSVVLNRKLALVPANNEVRIEYLGVKTNPENGRSYQDYKVDTRVPSKTQEPEKSTETPVATDTDVSRPNGSEEVNDDLPF